MSFLSLVDVVGTLEDSGEHLVSCGNVRGVLFPRLWAWPAGSSEEHSGLSFQPEIKWNVSNQRVVDSHSLTSIMSQQKGNLCGVCSPGGHDVFTVLPAQGLSGRLGLTRGPTHCKSPENR